MLNLLYYFSSFFLGLYLYLKHTNFYFFRKSLTNITFIRKSFFDLSIWEKFYLILFYDYNKDFLYFKKLIVDHEIIFFIRENRYRFYKILKKQAFKNFKNFNDCRKLYKSFKKFNLLNFCKIIPFNFNFSNQSNIFNLITTEIILTTKYNVNFYSSKEFYFFFIKILHFKSNNVFIKIEPLIFQRNKIYLNQLNQLQNSFHKNSKENNLEIFVKIKNFFSRILPSANKNHDYWQWIIQNLHEIKWYNININFNKYLKQILPIRYNPTTVTKYLSDTSLSFEKIYFLRKTKIFNKSRYSRNRQIYRTGVYWCLWLSIFLGWGLYFIFYRYTLNFGYLWWIVYLGLSLFIFVKTFNYRLYNYIVFINEFKLFFKWCYLIFFEFVNFNYNLINFIKSKTNTYILISQINFRFFSKFIFFFSFSLKLKLKKNIIILLLSDKISFKDFLFILVYNFL